MKPIIMAISAVILYSMQNVILEQKMARYNVFGVLIYIYMVTLPLTITGLIFNKMTNQSVVYLDGKLIILALALGLISFVADSCAVGAYSNGGSLIAVATIIALFPVTSSVVKYFWTGGDLPNAYQFIGYVFAFLAVVFVAKGSLQ